MKWISTWEDNEKQDCCSCWAMKSDIEKNIETRRTFINYFSNYTDLYSTIINGDTGCIGRDQGISAGSGIDFNTIFAFNSLMNMDKCQI
jgi:hypothetical protein